MKIRSSIFLSILTLVFVLSLIPLYAQSQIKTRIPDINTKEDIAETKGKIDKYFNDVERDVGPVPMSESAKTWKKQAWEEYEAYNKLYMEAKQFLIDNATHRAGAGTLREYRDKIEAKKRDYALKKTIGWGFDTLQKIIPPKAIQDLFIEWLNKTIKNDDYFSVQQEMITIKNKDELPVFLKDAIDRAVKKAEKELENIIGADEARKKEKDAPEDYYIMFYGHLVKTLDVEINKLDNDASNEYKMQTKTIEAAKKKIESIKKKLEGYAQQRQKDKDDQDQKKNNQDYLKSLESQQTTSDPNSERILRSQKECDCLTQIYKSEAIALAFHNSFGSSPRWSRVKTIDLRQPFKFVINRNPDGTETSSGCNTNPEAKLAMTARSWPGDTSVMPLNGHPTGPDTCEFLKISSKSAPETGGTTTGDSSSSSTTSPPTDTSPVDTQTQTGSEDSPGSTDTSSTQQSQDPGTTPEDRGGTSRTQQTTSSDTSTRPGTSQPTTTTGPSTQTTRPRPPNTPKELLLNKAASSKAWQLTKGNNLVAGQGIKLYPDGRVEGFPNPNVKTWGIEKEMLVLYDNTGKPAVAFNRFSTVGGKSVLTGQTLTGAKETYVFTETGPSGIPGSMVTGTIKAQDFLRKTWQLAKLDGSIIVHGLKFLPDRRIEGSTDPNFSKWNTEGKNLVTLQQNGGRSAFFSSFWQENGVWTIMGESALKDKTPYLLKEIAGR